MVKVSHVKLIERRSQQKYVYKCNVSRYNSYGRMPLSVELDGND